MFQLRQELERVVGERDRLAHQQMEFDKDNEERDSERKSLRAELREFKTRETRLITEMSDIEEENIALQKQVSVLKSAQVCSLLLHVIYSSATVSNICCLFSG